MQNLNSYIQLSSGEIIDLADAIAFPFTMSIAEIQDISKRQGGYSKTLLAAGTANNRRVFGQLFKANVVDLSFDLGVRKKCFYVENGTTVFRGYLQLLNVNKVSKNNIDGDGEVTFEVALRDDAGDFYSILSDRYLNDLDFSDMDHLYEWSAITSTSGHTWEDGYKYHQYQTSNTPNWWLEDFRPSIFAKQYFDRIFTQAGYTYTWSDLEDIKFDKMIIPYNGDKPRVREEVTLEDLFRASYATGTTGQTFILASGSYYDIIFDDDNDSSRNLFDTGGNYNPSTGIFTIPNHLFYTFVHNFTYEIYLSAETGCMLTQFPQPTPSQVSRNYKFGLRAIDPTLNVVLFNDSQFNSVGFQEGDILNAGMNLIDSGVSYHEWNNSTYGGQNETLVQLYFTLIGAGITAWKSGSTVVNVVPVVKITSTGNADDNYFRDWVNAEQVGQGQTIFMNDYVPAKIKQKDFIADIVKMFNLYITYDKDQNNHLIIKTRDKFYDEGDEVDISELLDIGQDYSIQFLPDLQKKKLLFTYKEANDELSKQYKAATNEIYGQFEYTFDNEFVRDTLTIGNSLFEETPLETNISGNITSYITGLQPKSGIKILYDGGWIKNTQSNTTWSISYFTTGSLTTTESYSVYPYAGHFYPNPINPEEDLNWGLNDYLYYNEWDRLTLSNLFNKYYKRFVNQIENGKLLTGYFKLDETFILNLDFSTKFYIHDSWWILNKIIDYNANGEQTLTKCEFISVDEGIRFNQQYITSGVTKPSPADWVLTTPTDLTDYNQIIGPLDGTVSVNGTRNTINSGVQYVDVRGSENSVGNTKSTTIIGTGNTVSGVDGTFVLGNNNTATTSNSIVVGDNIDTTGGLEGVYTDNLIVSSGGSIIVGGVTIFSGGTFDFCESGITTSFIYGCNGADSAIEFSGATNLALYNGGDILTPTKQAIHLGFAPSKAFDTILIKNYESPFSPIYIENGNNSATIALTHLNQVNIYASGGTSISGDINAFYQNDSQSTSFQFYNDDVLGDNIMNINVSGITLYNGLAITPHGGNGGIVIGDGTALLTTPANSTGTQLLFNTTNATAGAEWRQDIILAGSNHIMTGRTSQSAILGGSVNRILNNNSGASTRVQSSAIIVGEDNTITRAGNVIFKHNIIAGGEDNVISGTSSETRGNAILGSITNQISNSVECGILSSSASVILSAQRSAIIGSDGSTINNFDNSVIIGGSNITATSGETVYVPAISFQNEGIRWYFKQLNLGDWDMDATASITVAHGLSSTEFKKVRQIDVMIRDDADAAFSPLNRASGLGIADGSIGGLDSTNFTLNRTGGGFFDGTDYNATSYNRGWISFWYTPDA